MVRHILGGDDRFDGDVFGVTVSRWRGHALFMPMARQPTGPDNVGFYCIVYGHLSKSQCRRLAHLWYPHLRYVNWNREPFIARRNKVVRRG